MAHGVRFELWEVRAFVTREAVAIGTNPEHYSLDLLGDRRVVPTEPGGAKSAPGGGLY